MAKPRAGDALFLDTDVLLAATDRSRPDHEAARALLGHPRAHGYHGATSGQVIGEDLFVATRPRSANGLGPAPEKTHMNVQRFALRLAFCDETEAVSHALRGLVRVHGLRGRSVHDATIVASMRCHGMETLVTRNPEGFRRLPEVMLMDA